MSKQDVKEFIERVTTNAPLLQELKDIGGDVDSIIKLAEREDFSFDEDDWHAALKELYPNDDHPFGG